jgi:hypothetical protein
LYGREADAAPDAGVAREFATEAARTRCDLVDTSLLRCTSCDLVDASVLRCRRARSAWTWVLRSIHKLPGLLRRCRLVEVE